MIWTERRYHPHFSPEVTKVKCEVWIRVMLPDSSRAMTWMEGSNQYIPKITAMRNFIESHNCPDLLFLQKRDLRHPSCGWPHRLHLLTQIQVILCPLLNVFLSTPWPVWRHGQPFFASKSWWSILTYSTSVLNALQCVSFQTVNLRGWLTQFLTGFPKQVMLTNKHDFFRIRMLVNIPFPPSDNFTRWKTAEQRIPWRYLCLLTHFVITYDTKLWLFTRNSTRGFFFTLSSSAIALKFK